MGIPKKDLLFTILKYHMLILKSLANRFKSIWGVKHLTDFFYRFINTGLWLYVARKRVMLVKKAEKLSEKGIAVIAERFPLKEFWGMTVPMDGPRLNNSSGSISQWFSSIEAKLYNGLKKPEQVIVLQVEPEELRKRKSDLSFKMQSEKASFVNKISEASGYSIIDANRSYELVLLDIKRIIWEKAWR